MTPRHALLLGTALVTVASAADAQQSRDDLLDAMTRHVQICAEISDSAQRLACYDKVQNKVGDVQAPAPARTPTPLGTMPSQPPANPSPPATLPPLPAYTGNSQVGNPTPLDPPPSSYSGGSQPGSPTPLSPPPLAVPGGGTATLGGPQWAPVSPAPPSSDPDRAFNPRESTSTYRPPDSPMQRPQPPLRRTGPRPVPNYNQTMPLVSLAASNLTYGESRYWQVTVTVTSNTPRSLDTQVRCNFLNAGRSVGEAYLGPVLLAAGEQISTELIGPPTTAFVDSTNCRVMSP